MDISYFFLERSRFIKYFYETAAGSFRDTLQQIKAQEPPYDDPPFCDSGEPSYLEEWTQADEALEILGLCCISMLSSSLKLYFMSWEEKLPGQWDYEERKRAFKNGYLQGYRILFEHILDQPWSDSPVDIQLLEQVILARNREQHPEDITTMRVQHTYNDIRKFTRPFFLDEFDRIRFDHGDFDKWRWMRPRVHVSREGIDAAILEAEKLVEWLEKHLVAC